VNKLDRDGAAFGRTVKEIASRLHGWPAVCQIPWWEGGKGRFTGVGDAVNLCALKWESGGDGKKVQRFSLQELASVDESLANEIKKARAALVDTLCEFDDELLSKWLELGGDSLDVPSHNIIESLRRCVLDGSGRLIPVFAGASFRNIGVQPLLDAINDLLPDPTERPDPEVSLGQVHGGLSELLGGKLRLSDSTAQHVQKHSKSVVSLVANIEACALAFKVVNDPRRGILVYIRVYSGTVNRNAALWNTNLHITERAQRLLQMYGSDAVEISDIPAGQIGVIAGLRHARTGDTLVSYPGVNPKTGPPAPLSSLQLRPIEVPPPVFFAAVEPNSLSEERNVADILAILLREDPSLHVNIDEESGQMLLSGMGELHLEIARDRLVNDFKAKAVMGNIEIGYRECVLSNTSPHYFLYDREVAGKRGKAGCEAVLAPTNDGSSSSDSVHHDGNIITVSIKTASDQNPEESTTLPPNLPMSAIRAALINGASAALAGGPRKGFPLHSCHAKLTFSAYNDLFGADTTPSALASAARMAVRGAIKEALGSGAIGLMEPVMNVVISCDESSLGAVVHDLSSARGGHILSLSNDTDTAESETESQVIDIERVYAPPDPYASSSSIPNAYAGPGQQRHITARVPLKEMVGYLRHLRSLTGGRGTFIMSVDRFERLSGQREKTV
jgi:elongation factor G